MEWRQAGKLHFVQHPRPPAGSSDHWLVRRGYVYEEVARKADQAMHNFCIARWCETDVRCGLHLAALEEGREVLAPWTDESLRRGHALGPLLPAEAAALGLAAEEGEGAVLVAYGAGGGECDQGQLAVVRARSLVPWEGYLQAVVAAEEGVEAEPLTPAGLQPEPGCRVRLWRGELPSEGLLSRLFWALGFLEHAEASDPSPSARFLIDWTDCCPSGGGCANAWNALFEQPWQPQVREPALDAKVAAHYQRCQGLGTAYLRELWRRSGRGASPAAALAASADAAAREGRFFATRAFGPPYFEKFGKFVLARPAAKPEAGEVSSLCADGCAQGRGGLDGCEAGCGAGGHADVGGRMGPEMAARGRQVLGKWLRVRTHVLEAVEAFFARSMARRAAAWLAVHLRLTDRAERNARPVEWLEREVLRLAGALRCGGALLCSDDAAAKARLAARLRGRGLAVAEYNACLSQQGLPAHKDPELDTRANARDMLVECLLMAQCKALLGSWSNVSAAVIWMAPAGFQHFLFGDAAPGEAFEAVD